MNNEFNLVEHVNNVIADNPNITTIPTNERRTYTFEEFENCYLNEPPRTYEPPQINFIGFNF